MENKKLFLLDAYALAYRAYFALIRAPLTNSKGQNTSAVFGFANTLLKLKEDENPGYMGVAFDSKGPTFRHEKYDEYKATRQKMPDDLRYQVPWLKEMLKALGIPIFEMQGYEADDLIGTLSDKAKSAGFEVYLVTGDKDFTQLVEDNIYFYNIRTRDTDDEERILDSEGVKQKMGVPPSLVVDLLALEGDSSDNIPGIPKVGRKTAIKLLNEYGSMEGIYKNAEDISGKLGENVRNNKHLADLSLELAKIKTDLDMEFKPESFLIEEPDKKALAELFSRLDFHSLLEKFNLESRQENHDKKSQNYIVIKTREELDDFIEKISEEEFFVFDTETTSLDAVNAELVGISFSWEENTAYYIPVRSKEGEHFDIDYLVSRLKPLMEDSRKGKGGQNLKYDISILSNYGIIVNGVKFDTLLASYLLSPEYRKHNLDTLALDYLNYRKIPTSDLIGKSKNTQTMDELPLDEVAVYACEDADITLRLKNLLSGSIGSNDLSKLFYEVEVPLVPVLADMEMTGVNLDIPLLKEMSIRLEKDLSGLTEQIYGMSDEEFNVDSPQQLGKILFEKMKIHEELGIKRIRKTKTGYSTDARTLKQMSGHPIVEKILDYRHLRKLKSTYIDALPQLLNSKTGRIHTSYNQAITATGRLSSSDPNLQNIPIRTELGREIRKAFIPSDKERKIFSADYSQIEFRVAAHFSDDDRLIEVFNRGDDVHSQIAGMIYDIPPEEVEREQRTRAKEISFGILYGMNQYGLASRLKIDTDEAEEFLRRYFEILPGVSDYINRQLTRARKDGYVTTLYGRRRPVSNIESDNRRLKELAEHIAINTPVQGTAADIIKIAMINIWNEFRDKGIESKMIMQVHDELVFDVIENEMESVKEIVHRCMGGAADLKVPLEVESGFGENWLEAH